MGKPASGPSERSPVRFRVFVAGTTKFIRLLTEKFRAELTEPSTSRVPPSAIYTLPDTAPRFPSLLILSVPPVRKTPPVK